MRWWVICNTVMGMDAPTPQLTQVQLDQWLGQYELGLHRVVIDDGRIISLHIDRETGTVFARIKVTVLDEAGNLRVDRSLAEPILEERVLAFDPPRISAPMGARRTFAAIIDDWMAGGDPGDFAEDPECLLDRLMEVVGP